MPAAELAGVLQACNRTKEYMVMSFFCIKHGIDSEKEKIFFTIQLQISKYSSRNEAGENQAQLKAAAQDAIKCFERISCVQISDKEGLLEHCYSIYSRRYTGSGIIIMCSLISQI